MVYRTTVYSSEIEFFLLKSKVPNNCFHYVLEVFNYYADYSVHKLHASDAYIDARYVKYYLN